LRFPINAFLWAFAKVSSEAILAQAVASNFVIYS